MNLRKVLLAGLAVTALAACNKKASDEEGTPARDRRAHV